MLSAGLFLVSLSTLVFEIALIRVLSFTIWYHFAYVVISTALLGFGAAGALLVVRPQIGARDLPRTLERLCLGASATTVGFLALVVALPFDPMKILEQRRDLLALGLYEVGATVPFFFAGLTVSLVLRAGATRVDRLYFWDLLGAGLGCALAVVAMNALTPPGAVLAAATVLALASVAFRPAARAGLLVAPLLVAVTLAAPRIPFTPAASKHLSEHRRVQGLEIVRTRWTALFRTDVVTRPDGSPFPFREWGLSHATKLTVQPPWGYFTHDGTAGAPMYDVRRGRLEFLDDHILHIPYVVSNAAPRVLVIGVGGGRDVLTALRYGASDVTGVELDPETVRLLEVDYREEFEGLFTGPNVHLHAGEGRHFVERSRDRYDVIQITAVDTLAATSSGAYVLAENYLYTADALGTYLDHLTPGGILSLGIGEWNYEEPQAVGRMLLVAREALRARGVTEPERHLVAISSKNLITEVLVRATPFTEAETDRLKAECDRLDFPPLVLGGAPAHPLYARMLGTDGPEHAALLASLPYVIEPVTDDSPFFFRFFRWSELLKRGELGAAHTTALGQLVLVILLFTLGVLAVALIHVPMAAFRRHGLASSRGVIGVVVYFAGLGLGFMLLEISLMQRLVLYLGYPTYALTVVLFSLLTSLGIGSALSRRWALSEQRVLPLAVLALAVLVLLYRTALPALEHATLGAALGVRVLLTAAILAPLGVILGLFFPLGIRRAETIHPDLVPWAWGVNGSLSVVASVLAVIIAMVWGFTVVWVLAIAVYAVGTAALLLLSRPEGGARG